jgi:hypothetical protein
MASMYIVMPRKITKQIKIAIGSPDNELVDMFNQMIGAGSINMIITYPRYKRIKDICTSLVKLFTLVADSPFMRVYTEFAEEKKEILQFCTTTMLDIESKFHMDLTEYEWNLNIIDDALKAEFAQCYEQVKKSNTVNTFIVMCDKIIIYKKYIEDVTALNHKFIVSMPGVEWAPFPFTKLNLKYIYSLNIDDGARKFFMLILHKALELSYKLYKEVTSPDLDVDKFVELIMNSIEGLQKRPELNRCRKAFNKIRESINLLKTNFSSYYRDFINTQDSSIIMQHFILDVSKTTKADAATTHQLNIILIYYRKVAAQHSNNPKIKTLFEKIDESLKVMQRNTENIVNIDNNSSSDSSDSAGSDSETTM